MKASFIILAVLTVSALSVNLQSQSSITLGNGNENGQWGDNLVVNPDFETPYTGEGYGYFSDILGWDTLGNKIEVGHGPLYNKKWKKGVHIVEIDGMDNDDIATAIKLEEDSPVRIQFRYAATQHRKKTSGISVTWNGVQILYANPSADEDIHEFSQVVEGIKGRNILKFKAEAESDGYGVGFTNVAAQLPKTDPEEVEEC